MSKVTILAKKADFLQKKADIRKIKKVFVLNGIFYKGVLHMGVYLRAKFKDSSITVTSFRHGKVILPIPPPQNELL